jgi:dihydrofolate reductase
MRKIIVLSFMTLDGVMQAPGGPQEDTSGGFKYGGWSAPYWDDSSGQVMLKQMGHKFDMLLGRKTFDIFASYWPKQTGPIADTINSATKYVASNTLTKHEWDKSVFLNGDIVEKIRKLKEEDGPELQVHGSATLIQTLLKHDLVDELWLKIFPITLGSGKRTFADGAIPAAFRLTETSVTPKGVIIANYVREGEVKTGSL